MKTNLEELLNNTNLTPIQILEYYEEEITKQFEIYTNFYINYICSNVFYEKYINKENLEPQKKKITNLIKEFIMLAKLVFNKYYINNPELQHLEYQIVDLRRNLQHKYNMKNLLFPGTLMISDIKHDIKDIINKFRAYGICFCLKEENTKNITKKEKKYIEEFYVAELNRIIDEQETKISDLEAVIFQDKQNINDLTNEKIELKLARVLGDN